MISRGSTAGPRLGASAMTINDELGTLNAELKAVVFSSSFSVADFRVFECPLDRVGGDVEVRGRPDGLAAAQQDRLRRLVLDAGTRLDLARDLSALLHDDNRDRAFDLAHLPVGVRANGTRAAVLEQEHGLLVRAREELVERGGVRHLFELRLHRIRPCSPRSCSRNLMGTMIAREEGKSKKAKGKS